MRPAAMALMLLFFMMPSAPAQETQAVLPDGIRLETGVSQGVIRLGEVFEYRVRIRYPEAIDFVTEELEERLVLRPFEKRETRLEQKQQQDGRVLELVFSLVCYELPRSLEIPSFSLFYYPAALLSQGTISQQDVPAQALTVPPRPIQMYSTLVGEGDVLRDSVVLMRISRAHWILPGVAAMLLVGLVGWLVVAGLAWAVRRHRLDPARDSHRLQAEAVKALQRMTQPGGNGEGSTDLLEIAKLMRVFLDSKYGLATRALTPLEIREVLDRALQRPEFAADVKSLLEDCERVFFNPARRSEQGVPGLSAKAVGLIQASPEVERATD